MSKSTTKTKRRKPSKGELAEEIVLERWEDVQRLFHLDLDTSAKAAQALLRKKEIRSANDLLRLIWLYTVCDLSLRLTGLVAYLVGIGDLSDVAVMERLQQSSDWLGLLLVHLLQRRCRSLAQQNGVRLRLMDATVISEPGSKGTDWRIHLSLDLEAMAISAVEVTDAHGGESLDRFRRYADEIWVADRGYAFASGLGAALLQEVRLVVRINWQNLHLFTETGQRFELVAWLTQLAQPGEQPVMLPTSQGKNYPLRLIACPLPPEAAERARAKARKEARRKGRTASEHTLLAAGFLLLLTNLPAPAWPIAQVLLLYRLRWQVELTFKRFKSLLAFDQLRAKEDRLVQTYLLGKLLMVLILDGLLQDVHHRQPDWWLDTRRPISFWRLTQLTWELLKRLVSGPLCPQRFLEALPHLSRYLRNPPRARPQQDALARVLLEKLG